MKTTLVITSVLVSCAQGHSGDDRDWERSPRRGPSADLRHRGATGTSIQLPVRLGPRSKSPSAVTAGPGRGQGPNLVPKSNSCWSWSQSGSGACSAHARSDIRVWPAPISGATLPPSPERKLWEAINLSASCSPIAPRAGGCGAFVERVPTRAVDIATRRPVLGSPAQEGTNAAI